MGPPSSEIYLHVGECPEVWLQGHFQGMELRLSNTTNPPSVAYSTESQKTTKTHYVLQNSNKQFQYSFILFHPSSFALPPVSIITKHFSFPWLRLLLLNVLFLLMLFLFGIHSPQILFLVLLYPALNVLLDLISLPLFGSVLLCTFVLVSLSLCVCVWGDTYISSSSILSTHMQLALKFSYKKKKKKKKKKPAAIIHSSVAREAGQCFSLPLAPPTGIKKNTAGSRDYLMHCMRCSLLDSYMK